MSSEDYEILEAFKHLKPTQIAYFKAAILPEDNNISPERLLQLLQDSFTSYAVDCPSCGSSNVVKNGRNHPNTQRYKCNSCRKVFSSHTNSLMGWSKRSVERWIQYMECMSSGLSIRKSAEIVGIHRNTSFIWRHKIIDALKSKLKENLPDSMEKGISES